MQKQILFHKIIYMCRASGLIMMVWQCSRSIFKQHFCLPLQLTNKEKRKDRQCWFTLLFCISLFIKSFCLTKFSR
uniref:Uncharacterized protein n=1 Tax=Manihot esculenta TaxID=3983 RepID=A0A2C9VM09_MANES